MSPIITPSLENKGRTALITGASAGIGQEMARVFAAHGFDVVLVARRKERLETLGREIETRFGVKAHVVTADLADPAAPRRIYDEMTARAIKIDALVNNAGYGLSGFFEHNPWKKHADFLQVMIASLSELCHLFAPDMARHGFGRIINVASLAGHLPGVAGGTLYAASKSFVIKFSESLSHEYEGRNVYVTALCPGFTYSEFHDVSGSRAAVSEFPSFMWMSAEQVAREAYAAVMTGKPVIINGVVNKFIALLVRFLPYPLARGLLKQNNRNATPKTENS